MYTNKKRSENDQYNETSNHIQMKGYGGGGGGVPPRPPGSQPRRRRPLSFVLIVFTSFFICIPFILCFQCVFDLYLLLYFPILIFHLYHDVDHQEMMFKVTNKLQKHYKHVKKYIFRHLF